jgi:hypothetical protein
MNSRDSLEYNSSFLPLFPVLAQMNFCTMVFLHVMHMIIHLFVDNLLVI